MSISCLACGSATQPSNGHVIRGSNFKAQGTEIEYQLYTILLTKVQLAHLPQIENNLEAGHLHGAHFCQDCVLKLVQIPMPVEKTAAIEEKREIEV